MDDPDQPGEALPTRGSAQHRQRAVEALAEVVAERGYHEARVADVIARAGMSRRTFYELFSNFDECFLEAYDVAEAQTIGRLPTDRAETLGEWARHVEISVRSLMEYCSEEPALAGLFVVEALGAGPPGRRRHARSMRRFAGRLADSHPEPDDISDLVFEAGVGAVHHIVHARIAEGRTGELPELATQLSALVERLTASRVD